MKQYLKNKRAGIIGLGKSGIAAANLAYRLGADVLASESRPREQAAAQAAKLSRGIEVEYGGHSDKLLCSDLIIKSPGIHNDIPILKKLLARKIEIISEIDLAFRFTSPKRIIAITGTNGKTTTTTLVGEIFKNARLETFVVGNIGNPPASVAEKLTRSSNVIAEVSSYQLEDSLTFKPDISAILNITEDHIEHHHSMENYIKAKQRVFELQSNLGFCVLNYDDRVLRKLAGRVEAKVVFFSKSVELKKGVFYSGGKFHVRLSGKEYSFDPKLKIPGMHNVENALAATAIAACAGIKPFVIENTLAKFKGVEHRIEFVRELDGVRYINDSKGTNVDSTKVALESFDGNIWLILGGRDKGFPYTPIKELVRQKVKGIMLIGEASPLIKKDLEGAAEFFECETIKNAVQKARSISEPGDVVLLSPACASFDQFKDFEERGKVFKSLVTALK